MPHPNAELLASPRDTSPMEPALVHINQADFPKGTRLQVKFKMDENGYGPTIHDVIVSGWVPGGTVRLSEHNSDLFIGDPDHVLVIKVYNPFAKEGAGEWYTPRRPDEQFTVVHPEPGVFFPGTKMRVTIDDQFFHGVEMTVKILKWSKHGTTDVVDLERIFEPPLIRDDNDATDTFKISVDKVRVLKVLVGDHPVGTGEWVLASQLVKFFETLPADSFVKQNDVPSPEFQLLPHQLEFMNLITDLKAKGELLGYDVKVSF